MAETPATGGTESLTGTGPAGGAETTGGTRADVASRHPAVPADGSSRYCRAGIRRVSG